MLACKEEKAINLHVVYGIDSKGKRKDRKECNKSKEG